MSRTNIEKSVDFTDISMCLDVWEETDTIWNRN
jgi:hypothetical protein